MRVNFDETGTSVRLPERLTSVVSLVPSLTESIEATVPGLLVGATDYCVHPPDLRTTRVGGSKYPDVERIIQLRPDVVVANVEENRPSDVERMRAAGIPVWVSAAPESVPAACASLRRLCLDVLDAGVPEWLRDAEREWSRTDPLRATVVTPVWRRPWVVLGRSTFAGDVLRRIGLGNAFGQAAQRYPRPELTELTAVVDRSDGLVLPDEPYRFTADDGPDAFPTVRYVLVSGRHLTWWGPSLRGARTALTVACQQFQ